MDVNRANTDTHSPHFELIGRSLVIRLPPNGRRVYRENFDKGGSLRYNHYLSDLEIYRMVHVDLNCLRTFRKRDPLHTAPISLPSAQSFP